MGLGKLCLQSFLQYPSLKRVLGIEIVPSRAQTAFRALKELAASDRQRYRVVRVSEAALRLEEVRLLLTRT